MTLTFYVVVVVVSDARVGGTARAKMSFSLLFVGYRGCFVRGAVVGFESRLDHGREISGLT